MRNQALNLLRLLLAGPVFSGPSIPDREKRRPGTVKYLKKRAEAKRLFRKRRNLAKNRLQRVENHLWYRNEIQQLENRNG